MISYSMIEYVDNEPVNVHCFPPEADPTASTYQAVVSASAFDTRMCDLALGDCKARRFHSMNKQEWAVQMQVEERWKSRGVEPVITNLPKTQHADLWSFYRAVGWDYKSKRFI